MFPETLSLDFNIHLNANDYIIVENPFNNYLSPDEAIWCHTTLAALFKVLACSLVALIPVWAISQEVLKASILDISFEMITLVRL